jgi:ureidoacrylate peracid hydrolase
MTATIPFAPARWDLVPCRTAVVVIDPQNDFLHPDGWYAQNGIDIAHMRRSIEPTAALVAAARLRNIPIVWTRHGFRGDEDAGVFMALRPFLKDGGLRVGTWGYQIIGDVGAREHDWFVEKNRLSAFFNTNLELILRGLNAETVLFAGVLTNQCVAASSKDANFRDFKPVVVADCTGTTLPHLHEPALEMVRVGWGEVRSLDETLEEIEAMTLVNRADGALN